MDKNITALIGINWILRLLLAICASHFSVNGINPIITIICVRWPKCLAFPIFPENGIEPIVMINVGFIFVLRSLVSTTALENLCTSYFPVNGANQGFN